MKFCILILYISMVIHEKEFLRNINCSVLWRIWFRSHLAYKILYNRFISDLSVSGSCMFLFTIFRFLWHCDVSFKDRPDIRSNFWPCTGRKLFSCLDWYKKAGQLAVHYFCCFWTKMKNKGENYIKTGSNGKTRLLGLQILLIFGLPPCVW
mgnify:CR=1 FL=1